MSVLAPIPGVVGTTLLCSMLLFPPADDGLGVAEGTPVLAEQFQALEKVGGEPGLVRTAGARGAEPQHASAGKESAGTRSGSHSGPAGGGPGGASVAHASSPFQGAAAAQGGSTTQFLGGIFGTCPSFAPVVFTNSSPTAIPDLATVSSTIAVAGMNATLWDVDMQTFITHTYNSDLDITLTSPAGTTITITTDNGGGFDNGFNGTVWDDSPLITFSEAVPVTDAVYVNLVTVGPVTVEEAMGAFKDEDPNGTWTLTITDDEGVDIGSLNSWALSIQCKDPPTDPCTNHFLSSAPMSQINDNSTITDTLPALTNATGYIDSIVLTTNIKHTKSGDLELRLIFSGNGTSVVMSTNNGGTNDDVFDGTSWYDSAGEPVTDNVYTNGTAVVALAPEGGFSALLGSDANGLWSLELVDGFAGGTGTLEYWSLDITTCSCSGSGGGIMCPGDGVDPVVTTPCPCSNFGSVGNGCANSSNANGAHLAATGTANPDTIVLAGSGMPATVSCIYLQGAGVTPAGLTFGDGVRCVDGALIRLRTKPNVGGASSFPDATDTISLSARGGVVPGSGATRYYQTYYRNSASFFCPPETFNVTNGWMITW